VSSAALLRHFKDASLDKITPEDVERFKAARFFGEQDGKGRQGQAKGHEQEATARNRQSRIGLFESGLQLCDQVRFANQESGKPCEVPERAQRADAGAHL
jgi:hypothetical protein